MKLLLGDCTSIKSMALQKTADDGDANAWCECCWSQYGMCSTPTCEKCPFISCLGCKKRLFVFRDFIVGERCSACNHIPKKNTLQELADVGGGCECCWSSRVGICSNNECEACPSTSCMGCKRKLFVCGRDFVSLKNGESRCEWCGE